MSLEVATYINQLVATNPVGAVDPKSQGDDHIRLIKAALQATFPAITGAVTVTHTALNNLGAFTGFAAPSASVDVVAGDGGVATSALRSDARLQLSQAIIPTWSGKHIFSKAGYATDAAVDIRSAQPGLSLYETDAAADKKFWDFISASGDLEFRAINDAANAAHSWLVVRRTGITVNDYTVGADKFAVKTDAGTQHIDFTSNAYIFGSALAATNLTLRLNGVASKATCFTFQQSGVTKWLLGDGAASEDNSFELYNAGTGNVALKIINTTNEMRLSAPLLRANGIHNGTAPTGSANQYIASGTYTPTLTNVTNVASSSATAFQWTRVGNVVTVSGHVAVQATAGSSNTNLGISLPIASNFASLFQLGGTAASASVAAHINADNTNDRANMNWTSPSTSLLDYWLQFTYLVV